MPDPLDPFEPQDDSPPEPIDEEERAALLDDLADLAEFRAALEQRGAKYDAWSKLKGMSTDEAMQNYIKQVERLNRQLRPILGGKRVSYVRKSLSGGTRRIYTAQVGYSSRTEAFAFCSRLRSVGGRCIVLKN